MLTRREVMITMKTVRRGFLQAVAPVDDAEDADDVTEEELEAEYDDDAPDEFEMMMEGRLITTSRRVELSYDETELTGMEGTTTKLVFDPSNPSLISLLRSGSVSTALGFEPHKRHMCVYNAPFACFELCVHTLKITNNLLSDGELYLDYITEIHGARTEHCKMTVRVR